MHVRRARTAIKKTRLRACQVPLPVAGKRHSHRHSNGNGDGNINGHSNGNGNSNSNGNSNDNGNSSSNSNTNTNTNGNWLLTSSMRLCSRQGPKRHATSHAAVRLRRREPPPTRAGSCAVVFDRAAAGIINIDAVPMTGDHYYFTDTAAVPVHINIPSHNLRFRHLHCFRRRCDYRCC